MVILQIGRLSADSFTELLHRACSGNVVTDGLLVNTRGSFEHACIIFTCEESGTVSKQNMMVIIKLQEKS